MVHPPLVGHFLLFFLFGISTHQPSDVIVSDSDNIVELPQGVPCWASNVALFVHCMQPGAEQPSSPPGCVGSEVLVAFGSGAGPPLLVSITHWTLFTMSAAPSTLSHRSQVAINQALQ